MGQLITGADYYRTADIEAVERADPLCGPVSSAEYVEALRAFKGAGDGGENLKKYWLHGEGLKKWATKPHPWTTLYHHILKHVGSPGKAKRIASQWFHDHFGYWPGSRKGKNPVGKG